MSCWGRSLRVALAAIVVMAATGNALAQSNRRTAFKDLLRIYGCVHVVYLVAIASQSSSHGGLIFAHQMQRVSNGDKSVDFINQEKLRCGRLQFVGEASAASIRAFELLESAAEAMARAAVNESLSPEKARAEMAAALARFGQSELPEVSDIAGPRDLDAALGEHARSHLEEHEAWIARVMMAR